MAQTLRASARDGEARRQVSCSRLCYRTQLDELIALTEALAAELPLVRVDFYVLNDGSIRFGEMTFTSASGLCTWNPPETDLELGRKIDLSACPGATEYP